MILKDRFKFPMKEQGELFCRERKTTHVFHTSPHEQKKRNIDQISSTVLQWQRTVQMRRKRKKKEKRKTLVSATW